MMSIFTSDIPMLFQQNPVSALLLCAVILLVAALVLGFIYFQLFPKHKIYYGSLVAFTMGVIFFGGTFLCCYMAFDLYSNSRAWNGAQDLGIQDQRTGQQDEYVPRRSGLQLQRQRGSVYFKPD